MILDQIGNLIDYLDRRFSPSALATMNIVSMLGALSLLLLAGWAEGIPVAFFILLAAICIVACIASMVAGGTISTDERRR